MFEVVETITFTKRVERLGPESLRILQNELILNPLKGDVIPDCGGLRKIRWTSDTQTKGKRSGYRIIYLYMPEAQRLDMLDIYGKNEKEDITHQEKNILRQLAKTMRDEAWSRLRKKHAHEK